MILFNNDGKDTVLIGRILDNNDRQAADDLVRKYYKYIFKEIVIRVQDDELALDLVQETFISMLKGLNTFDSKKASFKTWVTRIACNKVIDYYRSRQYQEKLMTELLVDYDGPDDSNMEDTIIGNMAAYEIFSMLRDEKRQDKEILLLKLEKGLTFEEIGQRLGIKKSKAKNRYYGILKKLRKELESHEEDTLSQ